MTLLWQLWQNNKPRWENSILEDVVDRAIVFGAGTLALLALSLYSALDKSPERLPQLGVVTAAKQVERRSARDLTWKTIGVGSPIYQGDALRTESAGQISVALNNKKKLDLPGRTLVKINDITNSQVEVTVYQGTLEGHPGVLEQTPSVVEPLRRAPAAVLAIPLILSPAHGNE